MDRTYNVPKIEAEVYMIGEGSGDDPVALRGIKDWVRRYANDRRCDVLYMDDKIAVIEIPEIITISDPDSRNAMGLPPMSSLPLHFRDSDEG